MRLFAPLVLLSSAALIEVSAATSLDFEFRNADGSIYCTTQLASQFPGSVPRDRFSHSLRRITQWCRCHRYLPLAEQHRQLERKLRGHYAYYGITGNHPALSRFRHETQRMWRVWLDRRSQRARMSWKRFGQLSLRYPLPLPRVIHSVYRLAVSP